MVVVMSSTVALTAYSTASILAVAGTATVMIIVAVGVWRFPSSHAEWEKRKNNGEKIGWLK